jgi:RNA polymerase sigma-70 factor (ECF subfamily)
MPSMSNARTNEEWLSQLSASGTVQETAIADLRDLLLRAALYFFSRNLDDFQGLQRDEILQRAEDCAQEALIAVLNHLPDFRGDSKFTTWAYKFAINMSMMASRREGWKSVSLDRFDSFEDSYFGDWTVQDKSEGASPEQFTMQAEIQKTIQEVIEGDLTEKQRRVLLLMVFHDVPMDEVVRRLDTNRNAVYKLLHDARRKLKRGLQARGFEVGEMLTLFGPLM